jgi:hypothetical protein
VLAVHAMSGGAQAVCYFIALVAFVVAAVLAWISGRIAYATLIAVGLALWTLIAFWNALALS